MSSPTLIVHQLAHGLTVLMEPAPRAHTAAIGFFVRCGARDEDPERMGVSHFLEHMVFKGTPNRTADELNRAFDEIGADYNAYTGHEATVYYAHLLPEHLHEAIDLWTDMLRPALADSDFESERRVILEEIGMYDDQPTTRAQDELLAAYFEGHGLGHRVLGTPQTVAAMTPQVMREHHARHYASDRILVSIAGRFDPDVVLRQLERCTAHWSASAWTPARPAPSPRPGRLTLADGRINRCYIEAMGPAPAAGDPTRYAASLAADLVGDDEGSRLYWALVEPGLAEDASLSYLPQDGVGCYMLSASCDPDRADEVERRVRSTLLAFARGDGLEARELERGRNKLATQWVLRSESPAGRMRSIGSQWLYRREFLPLDEHLRRLDAVDEAAMLRLLREHPTVPICSVRLLPA